MLNDIKKSFNSLVHDGDWIDPETKKAALEKAESITNFIGYQEWLLKTGQLDEYYSSVCSVLNFSVCYTTTYQILALEIKTKINQ
jgi:predicted metalloendopeptidase